MKKTVYIGSMLFLLMGSCKNQDWEFPDFDHQTVYFAHQFPVRTITQGEDLFDTSLDNEGKFKIMATTGGVYTTKRDVAIDFVIDNSLAEGLSFAESGGTILPMPERYYQLAANKMIIPKGNIVGGVEVQLTDAFFNDPQSIKNTYVVPVRMTGVAGADSILSGVPLVANPNRSIVGDWEVAAKDFTLYAVKYINPWHGFYLRRGKDEITGKDGNGMLDKTVVRHTQYVEDNPVSKLTTTARRQVELPLVFPDVDGVNVVSNILLTFDENDNCTVTAASAGYTAAGTGKFVKRGEKNSWGAQDRDAIYLSYEIDLPQMHISATDTLVVRDRGVAMELFTPQLK